MALTDLLAPNEAIEYQSPGKLKYYDGGNRDGVDAKDFELYLTSQRLVFYRQDGLIFKSDVFLAWSKADLNSMSCIEKGMIMKKGNIELGGSGTNVRGTVEGDPKVMRQLYQQLQAYAGK
jgi:hypothetical protein